MKIKWKELGICMAIPLLVGGLAGVLSKNGMKQWRLLNRPPLSPPGWVFPVVWTILYTLMGLASYLVLTSEATRERIHKGLKRYGWQLAVNFLWPILFFNLQWYFFAFGWLLVLWGLIAFTIQAFSRCSRPAAYLMIPYLLWVSFAGYLNLGIALLNK